MDNLQIVAQRSWLIISACIVVVMSVAAIVLLVWWLVMNIKDFRRMARQDAAKDIEFMKRNCNTYAAAADAGWSQYIDMKDKYTKLTDDFNNFKKFAEKWDANKAEHIGKLEQQLKDNGITPVTWSPYKERMGE